VSGSFYFLFLVKATKNEKKISCPVCLFCLKMTADFFCFLVTLTKKRKTKNGMNLTIEMKVFHPLFHSTFYRTGSMQACKSTTYTHTEKKPTAELILDFCG